MGIFIDMILKPFRKVAKMYKKRVPRIISIAVIITLMMISWTVLSYADENGNEFNIVQITDNDYPDNVPRINSNGQVAWERGLFLGLFYLES